MNIDLESLKKITIYEIDENGEKVFVEVDSAFAKKHSLPKSPISFDKFIRLGDKLAKISKKEEKATQLTDKELTASYGGRVERFFK